MKTMIQIERKKNGQWVLRWDDDISAVWQEKRNGTPGISRALITALVVEAFAVRASGFIEKVLRELEHEESKT